MTRDEKKRGPTTVLGIGYGGLLSVASMFAAVEANRKALEFAKLLDHQSDGEASEAVNAVDGPHAE